MRKRDCKAWCVAKSHRWEEHPDSPVSVMVHHSPYLLLRSDFPDLEPGELSASLVRHDVMDAEGNVEVGEVYVTIATDEPLVLDAGTGRHLALELGKLAIKADEINAGVYT